MKRLLHTSLTLLFILTILLANPYIVLADEGDDGRQLEMEVNGYHITLTSQNEWTKGENTILVTLTDNMRMPVRNAEVEILIAPKADAHSESKTDSHGAEPQHGSMSAAEEPNSSAHDEEKETPILMMEVDDHGVYAVETHLESAGEHEVQVMFHANGEMLQADFVIKIPGTNSKTIVIWSFLVVNISLIASAGMTKRQPITLKGGQ